MGTSGSFGYIRMRLIECTGKRRYAVIQNAVLQSLEYKDLSERLVALDQCALGSSFLICLIGGSNEAV